jgi:hypothetical protein
MTTERLLRLYHSGIVDDPPVPPAFRIHAGWFVGVGRSTSNRRTA